MRNALLILLMAVTCIGQSGLRSPAFVGSLGVSAPCPVVNQDFESSGTPCNWSTSAGTPNFDNTASPLGGAQDLLFPDQATDCNAFSLFAGAAEVFIQLEIKFSVLPSSTAIIYVANGAFSEYLQVQLLFSGQLFIIDQGGASSATTTDAMSAGTPYWIFLHVLKGTGADASYSIEFATTSTRTGMGNKFATLTGAVASNLGWFHCARTDADWGTSTFQIDNVKFSTTGWPP